MINAKLNHWTTYDRWGPSLSSGAGQRVARGEQALSTLQEQVRRRSEELVLREKSIDDKARQHADQQAALTVIPVQTSSIQWQARTTFSKNNTWRPSKFGRLTDPLRKPGS